VRRARLGERMLGGGRIADVALQADAPDPPGRLGDPRGIDVEQRDFAARRRQHLAGREAKPGCPAGDDRRLTFDPHCALPQPLARRS
jgi:hypothetical protein